MTRRRLSQEARARALALLVLSAVLCMGAAEAGANRASAIVRESGVRGGLVVHLGCGDGTLTAALRINDRYLVHGLDTDAEQVASARRAIQSEGLYGPVSVDTFDGERLPYVDNLANLLVADELGDVSQQEAMRVLAPLGVAYVGGRRITKPWPDEIDEWTHFLNGAGNNAVAGDTGVGPPGRVQWTAGPLWSKEHDVTPSIFALVSGKGRLFYILNESPMCTIDKRLPDRYSVVARDAFNGVVLWKHPMADWYSSRVIWGHIPVHSERRLVVAGNRVYVTLGLQSPVTALDAATGAVVREYAGTERTSEILCSNGKLALVTRRTHPLDGLLAGRDGNRFRRGYTGPKRGGDELLVVRTDTGQCLWRRKRRCTPLTLAVTGGRVLFAEEQAVVCLELGTGKPVWRAAQLGVRTLVVDGSTVFVANADRKKVTLVAFDLRDGRKLWTRSANALPNFLFFFAPLDIFVARGLVWGMAEGLEWNSKPGSGHLLGLDPRTGEVRRRIPLTGAFTTGHHVRCYKGKATEDYLLFNKRGIEFIPLAANVPRVPNSYQWVRGTCRYGILPCNGLIYAPSHACACYPGAKVNGFIALAPELGDRAEGTRGEQSLRLERGPAFGAIANRESQTANPTDWPTYRGDSRRSGCAPAAVSSELTVAWRVRLGTKPSSPVVAGNKVLAASVDGYTLHALDARDGRALWSYPTSGRIDSPPTVTGGTAIFGCRDGWVYCLRLSDGELVWRFRAAPTLRRLVASGRLESPWPVHGSVLVRDGTAYFAAGTSSFLDGGIHVYGLDAATGELRSHTCLSGPDPRAPTSKVSAGRMPGAVPDILSCDATGLYLRHVKLDWQLSTPPLGQFDWGLKSDTHLLAGSGFLDDTLFNRTVWQYGRRIDRSQMLVVDGADIYGVRVYEGISWNCPVHKVGKGQIIFRQDVSKPVPQPQPAQRKRLYRIPFERYTWHTRVPIRVSAMLLAGSGRKLLFVAGVPDRVDVDDPSASIEGRRGARLLVLSAATGDKAAAHDLDAPPVWDGMAAANGRLYMSMANGTVVCLGGKQ